MWPRSSAESLFRSSRLLSFGQTTPSLYRSPTQTDLFSSSSSNRGGREKRTKRTTFSIFFFSYLRQDAYIWIVCRFNAATFINNKMRDSLISNRSLVPHKVCKRTMAAQTHSFGNYHASRVLQARLHPKVHSANAAARGSDENIGQHQSATFYEARNGTSLITRNGQSQFCVVDNNGRAKLSQTIGSTFNLCRHSVKMADDLIGPTDGGTGDRRWQAEGATRSETAQELNRKWPFAASADLTSRLTCTTSSTNEKGLWKRETNKKEKLDLFYSQNSHSSHPFIEKTFSSL